MYSTGTLRVLRVLRVLELISTRDISIYRYKDIVVISNY